MVVVQILSQCKPDKPDCSTVFCLREMCPDGSVAPRPKDGCCPDRSLCKPNCKNVNCLAELVLCPDGSPAPVPKDGCCQDRSLCKPNCKNVNCLAVVVRCPDGSLAPVPKDGCCQDRSLCKPKKPDCAAVSCLRE